MIFVSTGMTISIHPSSVIFLASSLAIRLSFARVWGMVFKATMPGPATTPGLRRTPPIIFLLIFNLRMKSLSPTTKDPRGEQRPLLRQNVKLDTFFTSSAGEMVSYAKPLNTLAPSTWTWIPYYLAILQHSLNLSMGGTSPSKVGNSSTSTPAWGDWLSFFFLITFLNSYGVIYPSGQSKVLVIILDIKATDPF